MKTREEPETDDKPFGSLNFFDLLAIIAIWASAALMLGLLVANYSGDQQVSLENAIGYIVIAAAFVSAAILFAGPANEYLRMRIEADREERRLEREYRWLERENG